MTTEEIIFEVLEATKLNWTCSKKEIYFNATEDQSLVIPDKYAVMRSDNNQPLGIVGNQYEFLQNHEMVEVVYNAGKELFDQNLMVKHPWNNASTLGNFGNIAGGSLRQGKAVFTQLELPDAYVGKSGIKRYISVTNHHDGTKSLGFGTTNQVICCSNTFAIANKELSKIRHTGSMLDRIDEAVISLRRMMLFEEDQIKTFEKASKIDLKKSHIEDVMGILFGKDNLGKQVSTRMQNQATVFAHDLDKSVDEQGSTLWALFNAVTRYTNHSRTAKDKDYSLMFGTDAKINQQAYKLIDSIV